MAAYTLTAASQITEPISVGKNARVTASGSGYVQWTPSTMADIRNGLATWQIWPRGATTGYADTRREMRIRGVSTGAMTLAVAEGYPDPGPDDEYWDNFGATVLLTAFGALGDGVTDDTAAIQAAIDSLGAGGGEVLFGPGTYNISSALNLANQSIVLRGASRFACLLRQTTASAKILNITGNYCGVKGLSFIYASTPTSGGTAIYVTKPYVTLDDFAVRSAYIGVHFDGGDAMAGKVTNFEILDYESIGLCAQSLNDLFVSRFLMNAGNTTRGALGGIRLIDKVEAFVCSDGDILLGAYSLTTDATINGIGTRPAYNNFTNVFFDSAANPVSISKLYETDFVGCWFSNGRSGGGLAGCNISTSQSLRFTSTRFFNCGAEGCVVNATVSDIAFIGCSFESNSVTAGAATAHGLRFADNTQQFQVIGCKASNGLYTGTQAYGIFIGSGCDSFVVSGNNVAGNATGGILNGATAATAGVIRDNIGHNPVGISTPTVSASPYTYTAGQYHESVYITGGTVSAIAIGGATVFTSTDKVVFLGPGQSVVITYSGAPTLKAWRH